MELWNDSGAVNGSTRVELVEYLTLVYLFPAVKAANLSSPGCGSDLSLRIL